MLGLTSCELKKAEEPKPEPAQEKAEVEEPKVDTEAIIGEIDAKRAEIEEATKSIEAVEVSTENQRAKIKQKWSKMHFYAKDGVVHRIKTYPHENVSKRTEEFYFDNNQLILVVIEDDGEGEAGKSKDMLDKMYYINNGELVSEMKLENKTEYNEKDSDIEELIQESKEYLDIYNNMNK